MVVILIVAVAVVVVYSGYAYDMFKAIITRTVTIKTVPSTAVKTIVTASRIVTTKTTSHVHKRTVFLLFLFLLLPLFMLQQMV